VASVVQPCFANSGFVQQCLQLVLIASWIERLAGRLGEHPAAFMPFGASVLAFAVL
jgi:hypothetical protein